jgi:hypothetical protein
MNKDWHIITKEDINRVPVPHVTGTKLDFVIQKECKRILYESMTRADEEYRYDEVGSLIDSNGNRLCNIYGYNGAIDVDSSDDYLNCILNKKNKNLVFVHNHPDDSKLSYRDILSLMAEESILATLAVGNSGGICYAVKAGGGTDYYMRKMIAIGNYVKSNTERLFEMQQKFIDIPYKYKLKVEYAFRLEDKT